MRATDSCHTVPVSVCGQAFITRFRIITEMLTVRVDGLAASIASVIAMSGDRLSCRQAQHHDSPSYAIMVDDMEKAKDVLMKIEEGITPIYAAERG